MSSYITKRVKNVAVLMLKVFMMMVIPIVLAALIIKWELTQAHQSYKQSLTHQRVTYWWAMLSHWVSVRLIKPLLRFGITKWENLKDHLSR